ncbi:hypothetical protein P152DRAFT_298930 [Eremomyces bilateralis CBS 781.70]|uniref:Centrosomin N-terminal motif 1 domain-containing protein n=1 Tax=Eremomyces bilateralis CBS 781.70 TaxID=1392243 RepID=A0A6G1G7W8_9PEZI|nr:uncharacterized protein P152DRAFT_298930 [Eremomyces bilateralis CBS 781.70]KAF1813949.1 hypothetical protein P152DRAFT_298930 [Eremomyces bilateralis CBS 781.70]
MSNRSPFSSSQTHLERTMSSSPSDTRSRRRGPRTLPSSPTSRPTSLAVEPKSEYLRDILRDKSARHDRARSTPRRPDSQSGPNSTASYIDSWVAAIEDDHPNNPIRPVRPRTRRASSVNTAANEGKIAPGIQRGLSMKDMDTLLDKQSKENFDLKLRICLQEEKMKKLGKELEETREIVEESRGLREEVATLKQEKTESQQQMEALQAENEELRKVNDGNLAVYENALKVLEERGVALDEAAEIIHDLQHRLTELDTAYETLNRSTTTAVEAHDSAYASAEPSINHQLSIHNPKVPVHVRSRDDLDLPKDIRPPTSYYDSDYFSASASSPRTEPNTPRSLPRTGGISQGRYPYPAKAGGVNRHATDITGSRESIRSSSSDGRENPRGAPHARDLVFQYGTQHPRPLTRTVRTSSPVRASGVVASFAERQKIAGLLPSSLLNESIGGFNASGHENNAATPTQSSTAQPYSAGLNTYPHPHPALRAVYLTHPPDGVSRPPPSLSQQNPNSSHPPMLSCSPADPVRSRPSHPPPGLKFGDTDDDFEEGDTTLVPEDDVAGLAGALSVKSLGRYSEGDARTDAATDAGTEVDVDIGNQGLRRYPEWPGSSMGMSLNNPRGCGKTVGGDRKRSVSDMGRRMAAPPAMHGDLIPVEKQELDTRLGKMDEKREGRRESRRESLTRRLEPPAGFLSFGKFGRKG